jgi:hypothetical protein
VSGGRGLNQDSGFRIQEAEEQVSGVRCRRPGAEPGFRIPDSGFRRLKSRFQGSGVGGQGLNQDSGFQIQDSGG